MELLISELIYINRETVDRKEKRLICTVEGLLNGILILVSVTSYIVIVPGESLSTH